MSQPKIIAYLKPWCGWSKGVRAIMEKYSLDYEDRDIINDPNQRMEMIQKSGQELSPCVEVDGVMLADVSGDEVEVYLVEKGLVQKDSSPAAAPTDSPCTDEEHAAQQAQQLGGNIRFISPESESQK